MNKDLINKVPYEANRGGSCALSCYTMVAKYLLPNVDVTFEKLAEIADYHKGYAVWGFRVWKWMIDRGIKIADFDEIDYDAVIKDGVDGLRVSVDERVFGYYKEATWDLVGDMGSLKLVWGRPEFRYTQKKVEWEDVLREFGKKGVCDMTLNSAILRGREGYVVHRVVLLDISDEFVVFHDPVGSFDGERRRVSLEDFRQAFEGLDSREVCRYWDLIAKNRVKSAPKNIS